MMRSQSSFKKLPAPEKKWVLLHPIKAIKGKRITQEVILVVDSIKKTGVIGSDNNGGKLDAFKHTYWMARLTQTIGARATRKLGIAHEKGNYLQYKNRTLEDAALPDSISSVMDLKNNDLGINFGNTFKKETHSIALKKSILEAAIHEQLYTIKKDTLGNFITCEGTIISMEIWGGKWNIPKCLSIPTTH
jgi:hypothetical protein